VAKAFLINGTPKADVTCLSVSDNSSNGRCSFCSNSFWVSTESRLNTENFHTFLLELCVRVTQAASLRSTTWCHRFRIKVHQRVTSLCDFCEIDCFAVLIRGCHGAASALPRQSDHRRRRCDHGTENNPGREKALAAAEAVAGVAIFPNFSAEQRGKGFTDFNDMGIQNPEVVSRQLDEVLQGLREQRLVATQSIELVPALDNA
jgi:hypothetical protein